jgi:hypothetical protein
MTTPATTSWLPGSPHHLSVPGTVTVEGVPYTFWSWSQGGGATQSITAPSTAATYLAMYQVNCTYSLEPGALTIAAGGGSGSFSVQAPSPCPWFAFSNNSWLTIGGGASGSGNGAVSYHVAANLGSTPRSGTVTVAGQPYTVTQQGFGVSAGLRFVPVTPCRVADTRNVTGPFGGPNLSMGGTRDFMIPNSACGIPVTALAYSLNVAVVPAGPLGYLTVWPTGQPRPQVSTVNSLDGRVKSNAAIVPGGAGGAISVFASNATAVVLDVNGYFVPATESTALAFFPLPPCRVVDTRNAAAPLGGPSLSGGAIRTLPILAAAACNIPASARAYSLNLTAAPKGPLGYLTAWPGGQSQPLVASLNAPTGTVTANAAIVPAGSDGSIDIFASNPTDLIIDINGYFAPATSGGLSFYATTPCRALDTRLPTGSPAVSGTLAVSGACGVAAAEAYVFSATAVPSGPLGYLTMWAQGASMPIVATLNALDATVTSNLGIVPAVIGGVSAFASNPTHLVLDLFGYFAP